MQIKSFNDVIESNKEVPAEKPGVTQDCSDGLDTYDEQFHFVDENDNPLKDIRYRISASTGEVFEGTSDLQGFSGRLRTRSPATLTIEVFEGKGFD